MNRLSPTSVEFNDSFRQSAHIFSLSPYRSPERLNNQSSLHSSLGIDSDHEWIMLNSHYLQNKLTILTISTTNISELYTNNYSLLDSVTKTFYRHFSSVMETIIDKIKVNYENSSQLASSLNPSSLLQSTGSNTSDQFNILTSIKPLLEIADDQPLLMSNILKLYLHSLSDMNNSSRIKIKIFVNDLTNINADALLFIKEYQAIINEKNKDIINTFGVSLTNYENERDENDKIKNKINDLHVQMQQNSKSQDSYIVTFKSKYQSELSDLEDKLAESKSILANLIKIINGQKETLVKNIEVISTYFIKFEEDFFCKFIELTTGFIQIVVSITNEFSLKLTQSNSEIDKFLIGLEKRQDSDFTNSNFDYSPHEIILKQAQLEKIEDPLDPNILEKFPHEDHFHLYKYRIEKYIDSIENFHNNNIKTLNSLKSFLEDFSNFAMDASKNLVLKNFFESFKKSVSLCYNGVLDSLEYMLNDLVHQLSNEYKTLSNQVQFVISNIILSLVKDSNNNLLLLKISVNTVLEELYQNISFSSFRIGREMLKNQNSIRLFVIKYNEASKKQFRSLCHTIQSLNAFIQNICPSILTNCTECLDRIAMNFKTAQFSNQIKDIIQNDPNLNFILDPYVLFTDKYSNSTNSKIMTNEKPNKMDNSFNENQLFNKESTFTFSPNTLVDELDKEKNFYLLESEELYEDPKEVFRRSTINFTTYQLKDKRANYTDIQLIQQNTKIRAFDFALKKNLSWELQTKFGTEINEELLENYVCTLVDKILLQGKLYITHKRLAFNSYFNSNTLFGDTIVVIPIKDIQDIEKTYGVFNHQNTLHIHTTKGILTFTSFSNRDRAFNLINNILNNFGIIYKKTNKNNSLHNAIQNQDSNEPFKLKENINTKKDEYNQEEKKLSNSPKKKNLIANINKNGLKEELSNIFAERKKRILENLPNLSSFKVSGFTIVIKNTNLQKVFEVIFGEEGLNLKKKLFSSYWEILMLEMYPKKKPTIGKWSLLPPKSFKVEDIIAFGEKPMIRKLVGYKPVKDIPFLSAFAFDDIHNLHIVDDKEIILIMDVKFHGSVPFTDTFTYKNCYIIKENHKQEVTLEFRYTMEFIKSTIFKRKIERTALEEINDTGRIVKGVTDGLIDEGKFDLPPKFEAQESEEIIEEEESIQDQDNSFNHLDSLENLEEFDENSQKFEVSTISLSPMKMKKTTNINHSTLSIIYYEFDDDSNNQNH